MGPYPDQWFALITNAQVRCQLQARSYVAAMTPIIEEWDDTNKLAGQTARMSLSTHIAKLQDIRRRTGGLDVPACAKDTQRMGAEYMDAVIDGYLKFMAQDSDATVSAALALAETKQTAFVIAFAQLQPSRRYFGAVAPLSGDPAPVVAVMPTSTPTAAPRPTATPRPRPTATPRPRPTATPTPADLAVSDTGFAQDGLKLSYAFIIENPNQDQLFANVKYQVIAYDAGGAAIGTDDSFVEGLFPGEHVGVSGRLYITTLDGRVASIEVQVQPSETQSSRPLPQEPLRAENITIGGRDGDTVTAIIKSALTSDITNVEVSAVAYNAAGKIIGGGFTYVNFVPAQGKAAAEIYITTTEKPTRVDLYPRATILSEFDK